MFGKMKKMFRDEEGTGILGAVAGVIGGTMCGFIPTACVSWICGPLSCWGLGPGAVVGGLCGMGGGALGGVCGSLLDYLTMGAACIGTTMSACFGSVGSCINFIPSLLGGGK